MTDIAVRVENLGKLYRIGQIVGYGTLRESLTNAVSAPFRRLRSARHEPSATSPQPNFIWALKDVSFEVKRGEAVGIIGRNGSGKTTILKILSRITAPTEGYAEVHGRVGSLLEVGTGFHPELTGRENIYLNGAVIGMKKAEVDRKFDEIVAFSNIEKFLDTPVKRYSSGMYVRLAFAVAAHLDPEVLIVDEVLAVGDAAFQKKCLGRIEGATKEGRTVLFVSHNMAPVKRLCKRAICLDEGKVQMIGATEDVVASYLLIGTEAEGERRWENLGEAPGNERIRLRAVRVVDSTGRISTTLDIRMPFCVEIEYDVLLELPKLRVGFRLITADGTVVFTSADTADNSWQNTSRFPGKYVSRCQIPGNLLNEGQYSLLNVWADVPFVEVLFLEENLLSLHVEQTGGVSAQLQFPERWSGAICPQLSWTITIIDKDEKSVRS
jgi:lipopolysaccharide transport system ATP-binding protein